MAGRTYTTRPIGGLTGAVVVWTWITIVLLAVSTATWVLHGLLLLELPAEERLTSIDAIPGHQDEFYVTGVPQLLALIASAVLGFLVLRWCHRASRNSNAMARGVETAPHWAIWWWFIPIGSLFKPYSFFSEFWRVAHDPDRWKSASDPVRLRLWWGMHLGAGFVAIAVNVLDRAAHTVGGLVVLTGVTILMQCLQVVGGLLFIGIVREIGRLQTGLIDEGRTALPRADIPGWAP